MNEGLDDTVVMTTGMTKVSDLTEANITDLITI